MPVLLTASEIMDTQAIVLSRSHVSSPAGGRPDSI
jgi:hypothetical protein